MKLESRWDSVYNTSGTSAANDSSELASAYLSRYDSKKITKPSKDALTFRTKLFGTPIKDLIMDDRRCKYALLDSHIGIPRQVHNMISVLHRSIDLPGLFRHRYISS